MTLFAKKTQCFLSKNDLPSPLSAVLLIHGGLDDSGTLEVGNKYRYLEELTTSLSGSFSMTLEQILEENIKF